LCMIPPFGGTDQSLICRCPVSDSKDLAGPTFQTTQLLALPSHLNCWLGPEFGSRRIPAITHPLKACCYQLVKDQCIDRDGQSAHRVRSACQSNDSQLFDKNRRVDSRLFCLATHIVEAWEIVRRHPVSVNPLRKKIGKSSPAPRGGVLRGGSPPADPSGPLVGGGHGCYNEFGGHHRRGQAETR
jgi:hypothetical protein